MKTMKAEDSDKNKPVLIDEKLADHHVKNVLDMANDFFTNTQTKEVQENGSKKEK